MINEIAPPKDIKNSFDSRSYFHSIYDSKLYNVIKNRKGRKPMYRGFERKEHILITTI